MGRDSSYPGVAPRGADGLRERRGHWAGVFSGKGPQPPLAATMTDSSPPLGCPAHRVPVGTPGPSAALRVPHAPLPHGLD